MRVKTPAIPTNDYRPIPEGMTILYVHPYEGGVYEWRVSQRYFKDGSFNFTKLDKRKYMDDDEKWREMPNTKLRLRVLDEMLKQLGLL